jgi:hypothetical protein
MYSTYANKTLISRFVLAHLTRVWKKANFGILTEKRLLKTKELWALVFSVLGFFYSLNAGPQARRAAGAT